ncbi:MAG: hypothetical protein U9N49_07870 [Campylobacterota bacterium]|nr:hypothetical protein [Campylobacterota bacterium]
MNYKTYLKNHEEVTIKLRIIKHRIVDKEAIKSISYRYSMHRNSVRNIINLYEQKACLELKNMINSKISLTSHNIENLCCFLKPKSRKPLSHSKQANEVEEKQIIDWYEKTKV